MALEGDGEGETADTSRPRWRGGVAGAAAASRREARLATSALAASVSVYSTSLPMASEMEVSCTCCGRQPRYAATDLRYCTPIAGVKEFTSRYSVGTSGDKPTAMST